MAYEQLPPGTGPGGDYADGDLWTPEIGTLVRDDFDDHETRLLAAEVDVTALEVADTVLGQRIANAVPFTAPSDTGFAWVNQTGASIDVQTNPARLTLVGAATGSATANLQCRVKTAPATPYTITAAIVPQSFNKNFNSFGLLFRQSSDGKIQVFDWMNGLLRSTKYISAIELSADYRTLALTRQSLMWLRIQDTGTNRVCSISADGEHWVEFHTVSRTDFLTADQVGFCVGSENGATPNFAPILQIRSWAQS